MSFLMSLVLYATGEVAEAYDQKNWNGRVKKPERKDYECEKSLRTVTILKCKIT